MGIIAFIRALAFIMSVFVKIIAIPFVGILKLLKICYRCLRFLVMRFRRMRAEWRIRRKERSKERKEIKAKRLERCIIQRRIRSQKKQHERKSKLKKKKKLKNLIKKTDNVVVRIIKRIYIGGRTFGREMHWRCRIFFQKIYWGCCVLFQKVYWKARALYEKAYWLLRKIFQKTYWTGYSIYQKIYWFSRGCIQKLYWLYYAKSRKLYRDITKNEYIDLFFVFFRGYLKAKKNNLNSFRILGTKEYIKIYDKTAKYEVIEGGRNRTVCVPEFFEKNEERLECFTSPDIYVAEIQNVCLIGGSNVLTAKKILINDAAYYDKESRIDIRYSSIKTVINGIALVEDQKEFVEIEKGINLVGAASFNYYHLVVEILSKLTFVDKRLEYQQYPILVDEVVLKIPQFRAALECVNKFEHPIIEIIKGKKYLVHSLVEPSPNVWMPTNLYDRNNIRTSDFLISETVLDNIREAVGVIQGQEPLKKIFVSRKNTQAVRLKNEEAVRSLFAENGFEIVFTEEMTFREQVECFGRAKCVVAASGAALTNIIFCQPGTLIGCIIPSEHRFYMYSTIAYLLNLRPLFLDGQIVERTPYAAADSFVLNEDYVKRYIQRLEVEL